MHSLFLWLILSGMPIEHQYPSGIDQEILESAADSSYLKNKVIPEEIKKPVMQALSYFPELAEVDITFAFKDKISGSIMQAQPRMFSLLVDTKENRKYKINITRYLDFEDKSIPIEEVPYDALVGWIGHELGHIMDYLDRSTTGMMRFGVKYMLSDKKVIEAELTADGYAIGCGMGHQIVANKNFILNNDNFEEAYKDKIRNLYMSPSQILSIQEALGK
ncbi:hypothetical protein [Rhodonellum sp.]|uniref:hypothetical protein n=1 Tax=Rhodonellum sp. TaxID=2231180 RepID=UPI002719ECC3|nr:hypothetical protein [Rhodonellum sp.]MDO9554067.1 hypothetical protein [Rhodonellum sp.]